MRNVIATFALAVLMWPPLAAAKLESLPLDPEPPLAGAPVRLVSNGVPFLVPDGYIHDRTARRGPLDGFFLWALWPGLVPRHAGNMAAFDAPGGGAKLDISIKFFKDSEHRSAYLWRWVHRSHAEPGKPFPDDFEQRLWVGERYGLKAGLIDFGKVVPWLSARANQPVKELDDFAKGRWDDLFYREDGEGQVQTVMECSTQEVPDPPDEKITGKEMIRVPHCRHQFVIDEINASVWIDYRRIYFSDWKKIEDTVRSNLLKFRRDSIILDNR